MALLYIVRHGQTEYNAQHIVQGRCDSPLTDLGVKQVNETAEQLKDIDFSACYYSPLGRTTTTADILLQHHNIERIPHEGLMEIYLGTLEGKSFFSKEHADDFTAFWKYPDKFTGEKNQAESYDALEERIYNCYREIIAKHEEDEPLLIVSHGAAIRSFINPILNRPRTEFWAKPEVKPASISIVKWASQANPELISYAGICKEDI